MAKSNFNDLEISNNIFKGPAYRTDLVKLPSGDWIDAYDVKAVRLSEKPNKSTGEMGAHVYISCDGSWFTVSFKDIDVAVAFMDGLAEFRNSLHQKFTNTLSREQGEALVATVPRKNGVQNA